MIECLPALRMISCPDDPEGDIHGAISKTHQGKLFEIDVGRDWVELITGLRKGNDGPPIDTECAFMKELMSLLQHRYRIDAEVKSMKDEKLRFTKFIHIHENNFHTHEIVGRYVVPGNCIQLMEDRFAQVILTNVTPTFAMSSKHMSNNLVVNVFDFNRPNLNSGNHPDAPVKWLKRQHNLVFISDSQVRRRALVIPLFQGGEKDAPCEAFPSTFLVDESVFPYVVGPQTRKVFMRCPHLCGGLIPKTDIDGEMTACPSCAKNVRWL